MCASDLPEDNSGERPEDGLDDDPLLAILAADPRLLPLLNSEDPVVACAAWHEVAADLAERDARYREATPDQATTSGSGTWGKVEWMAYRLAQGQPLCMARLGQDADLDDHVGFTPQQAGNQITRADLVVVTGTGQATVQEHREARRGGHRRRTPREKMIANRKHKKQSEADRKRDARARRAS